MREIPPPPWSCENKDLTSKYQIVMDALYDYGYELINHNKIIDYSKLECPFVKVNHLVTADLSEGFEWLYDDGVRAVDKLHGTNCCVVVKNGNVLSIDNRETRIWQPGGLSTSKLGAKVLLGVLHAIDRGWLKNDGRIYGELIGPDINNNIHEVDDYLFVPFDYLCNSCHWQSWIQNKYPKDFQSISDWYRHLPSLFSKHVLGKDTVAEGLVFYHPDGKRKCKLRRDQFDWFEGKRHKE